MFDFFFFFFHGSMLVGYLSIIYLAFSSYFH